MRAEYRRSPSDASRLLVFNQAKRGSVTGPPQSGSSFLLNAVVKDEARGRLAVGPSFLPSSAYGPYWVIAAGPLNATDPGFAGYEWAVIRCVPQTRCAGEQGPGAHGTPPWCATPRARRSGGPPTEQGTNGTCTNSRVGTPGVGGGEGLWLFSREPTPSEDVFKKLQGIAAAKGFDLSVLVRVQQAGCSYQPFPTSAGSASVPSLFSG